jgi:hypothetical protein
MPGLVSVLCSSTVSLGRETNMRAPKSVEVSLDLRFFKISGTWEPNYAERLAAWELYVELMTRVAVVPLPAGQGLLREALASLYSLFATTRDILRRHGPTVAEPKPDGEYNFGYLAVAILNGAIRPLLAHWHPLLEDWEASRPPGQSRAEYERTWPLEAQLRAELDATRGSLTQYAALLAAACGVPDLSTAMSKPATEADRST